VTPSQPEHDHSFFDRVNFELETTAHRREESRTMYQAQRVTGSRVPWAPTTQEHPGVLSHQGRSGSREPERFCPPDATPCSVSLTRVIFCHTHVLSSSLYLLYPTHCSNPGAASQGQVAVESENRKLEQDAEISDLRANLSAARDAVKTVVSAMASAEKDTKPVNERE